MDALNPGWAEKNNYEIREWKPTPPAIWGLCFENDILDYLDGQTPGEPIEDREGFFVHKDLDYLSCHVDGIHKRIGAGKNDVLIEVKTVNPFSFAESWGDPGTDEIPRSYQCQLQHNLMLTGLKSAELWVLVWPSRVEQFEAAGWVPEQGEDGDWAVCVRDGGGSLKRVMAKATFVKMLDDMGYLKKYVIQADTATQALMLNHYRAWWSEFVDGEKEPPIKRAEDVIQALKGVLGIAWADDSAERLSSAYGAIGLEIKKLEIQRKEVKKGLLEFMRANVEVGTGEEKKLILKGANGDKLHSWSGKAFR